MNQIDIEVLPKESQGLDPREQMRSIAVILDSAFTIPGTRIRFGFDSLIGLVPGIGDVIGAALSSYIILVAARSGASRLTLARMIINVVIETVIGFVPIVGDLFDVLWKANRRNVDLFEQARLEPITTKEGEKRLASTLSLLTFVGSALILLFLSLAVGVFIGTLRLIF